MFSRYQNNVVKLTSFELATSINLTEESKRTIIECSNSNLEQIPYKLLPHFVEYRQMYSEENFQSPELIATDASFVFPTKQSDVYGITLTLWEMLNGQSPCAIFGQHPNFNEERCRDFKEILKLGLEINPNKRVSDALTLNEMISKVFDQVITRSATESFLDSLLHSRSYVKDVNSPMRKKGYQNREMNSFVKQLQNSDTDSKTEKTEQDCINSTAKGEYQFDVGEFSLPKTPIALSNKLRRAAWLSNSSISPIVHAETPEKPKKTKTFQVNITIVQKSNESTAADNLSAFSNNMMYSHALGSASSPPPNNIIEEIEREDSNCNTDLNSENQFNEIYQKNHLSSNNDFENSLWRKEKEKCESKNLSNPIFFSPSKVSVKEAVSKFESFTKSFQNNQNDSENNRMLCKISKSKSFINNSLVQQPRQSISKASSLDDVNLSKLTSTLLKNVDESLSSKLNTPYSSASELNMDKVVNTEQPQPLRPALNMKNSERRKSDCGTYFIRPQSLIMRNNNTEDRHSIIGNEVWKTFNKASGDQSLVSLRRKQSKKLKVGKLTCLNCGYKLFLVDDGGEFCLLNF